MTKENGTDIKIIVFAIALSIVIFIVGLSVAYYWDSFKNPSGDEHSVPATKTY